MATNPSDTLNIQPLSPFGGTGEPKHLVRDHAAVEEARAKIAALPDVHATASTATPELVQPSVTNVLGQTQATPTPPAEAKASPHTRPEPKMPSKVKPIMAAVGSFLLLLILFKSQIIFSQIKYLTASQNKTPVAATVPAAEVVGAEPVLNIPKINVSAPIVFVPTNQEAAVQKGLEGGVVHYANTPMPGQTGNSVIVGHSSNDWWEPGNYKFVFVLLDKLVVGDTFSVNYQSKKYVYQVTESKVVEPTDVSVLAPTAEPSMTIITCTPPGTSWKRLVVVAKQISPDPHAAAAATTSASGNSSALPGSAPTWWDQIKSFFSGNKASTTTPPESVPSTSLPGAK
jgi:sortase A